MTYTVEFWTKMITPQGEWDMYAVVMPDGFACAFGTEQSMRDYADKLNTVEGLRPSKGLPARVKKGAE